MSGRVTIRAARPADGEALAAIYGAHVLHGTATFEIEPPDAGEMRARMAAVTARGWPWLIAEQAGEVIGYAYCARYRDRAAYRFTCEDSIYVREDRLGAGAGRALMAALIEAARTCGFREMIAVIGDADNAASIGLHAAFGFGHAGQIRRVGIKFERWLDVVYMQCSLSGA